MQRFCVLYDNEGNHEPCPHRHKHGTARPLQRACGGIGRRARLRIWWFRPCRFESYQAHTHTPDNIIILSGVFFSYHAKISFISQKIYFSFIKDIFLNSQGYILHPSKIYSSTVKDISFTHQEYVFHQSKIYPSFRTNIFFAFHTYINIRTRSPRPFSVNIQMKARNSHPRATSTEKRASRHAAHTQKDGARRSSNNRMRHLYIHGLSV